MFRNFNFSLEEEEKKRREDFGQQFVLPTQDHMQEVNSVIDDAGPPTIMSDGLTQFA